MAGVGELVGRAVELRRVTEAIARTAEGHGGAVLVAGEPGIGKTRLASEAVATAQARGFLILEARAYPLETGLAYAPIVDAFGPYLRELRPTRRAVLAGDLPALGRLFGDLELGAYEPFGDPAVDKLRLFEAVARLAERLAAARPLLLLMDDVHSADSSSLELLHYLGRGFSGRRALLLATARDDADSLRPLRPLLASLRREGVLDEIRLARLDARTMATFVRHLLNGEPPPRLLELLERRAGGVPLFAEALVHALLETGQLPRGPEGWSLRGSHVAELPSQVTDLILERVERLQSRERHVLELVAVGSDAVPHALLASVAELEGQALVETTARLRAIGLLDEVVDGASVGYRARHPLIQEVVYAELGEVARRKAHARFAAALERDGAADVERLARHYRGAGPEVDSARAVEVLLDAGARALELSACDEAVAHFSSVAGLLRPRGDVNRLPGVLESLGLAWEQLGEPGAAAATWQEALPVLAQRGDTVAAARLHGRLAFVEWERGRLESAGAHLDAALRLLKGRPSKELVDVLATQVRIAIRAGAVEQAAEHALRLNRMVAELRSPRDAAQALLAESLIHQARFDATAGLWASRQALEAAEQAGDPLLVETAHSAVARALLLQGDHPGLRAHAEAALRLARQLMAPHLEARHLMFLAAAELYAGDWLAAERLDTAAMELARRAGQSRTTCIVLIHAAIVAALRGDETAAAARLSEAVERFPEAERDVNMRVLLEAARAVDACERDEYERTEVVAGPGRPYTGEVITYRLEGVAAARLARGDGAGALEVAAALRRLGASERSLPCIEALRLEGVARGLLGEREAALDALDRAVRVAADMRLPFQVARCRLDWARVNGSLAAAGPLRESLAAFEQLGARGYAARARRALRQLGLTAPVRVSRSPTAGLSEREREVACLVAQGLTTAEVARRLCISYHTANTHLKRIYARLGVTSRAALARYAAQAGWLEPSATNT
jgi:DNA-binding CsgD family transcriptional regulator